ncbi:hypothetical protein E2R60_22795 [Paenibacillus dendritiformis]|uniref:hypothetical protein n=1 Tax=Paenibacillus dendritiformis TaxID=130049 RepID=UPI00105A5C0A|nr:hypothetical protein [Paenibacillus dendritiformis]TDL50365.1 hypothetical protein E2R60_22795 [Paenibacillus dendritiformis]
MAFKSSVNIKFDIGNVDFIKRYIPTPSHAEAMRGIIEGFVEGNANRSHIIVGPYGTGKSLLANVIGSLVAKLIKPNDISTLVNKFEQVDDDIATTIKEVSNLPVSYLPILLTGNEGRFRQSILSNVLKKLKEQGIDVLLPGLATKILDSIKVWENNFPETYKKFNKQLERDGKQLNRWIEEIKKHNEREIRYFSGIYPLLTAGASFDIDYDHSFLSQVEYLAAVMQENNLGIFIVYDEFARFLQGLNTSKFNETMQDIQDLAEFANRSKSIHFLVITHKSLRHYFNTSNDESAREFQRIDKRFNHYLVESDQATFLRIAEIIMTENIEKKPRISAREFTHTQGLMRKYPLFPSINQTERDELVIRGMFPLHPVSIFLLPNLTRVFGQNERTLFTFLESQETGGLINHISKTNEYYLAHQLFDFFFPDSNDIGNDEISEHIVLFKKAMARLPQDIPNKQLSINMIKIITLWNLCSVQSVQKLTTDFLQFTTQISKDQLSEILSLLTESKVIRFNRVNDYWELFAGNSIDLHEKLEYEKQLLKFDQSKEIEVLQNNLHKKFFFPDRYNDEKGMTRFATIRLVYGQDILQSRVEESEQFSDLTIYYVLPEDIATRDSLETVLSDLSRKSSSKLYFLHPEPVEGIKDEIHNYIGLELLKRNKSLLAEDKGIKEELEILINENRYRITKYLSEISSFNGAHLWYLEGQRVSLNSEFELTDILSEKCYSLYKNTPIVLNDSFNRNSISGAQRKAAILLIDKILTEPQNIQFGMTGNGPEYALYASIFKNNDRFDQNINKLDYSNIKNESFSILRAKLIEKLEKNPTGSLKDLIDLFTAPPFGIRKPLIPILFVALLRDRWNEFMLYRNEMFVPGINGAKLFDIIVEAGPENYQYAYESITQDYIEFFNKIELYFQEFLETRLDNHSRLIYICGTLLKWLRSLPRIIQTSEQIDHEFRQFRDCIKRSEIDPQQTISQIYKLYHNDVDKMLTLKQYGEKFISILKKDLIDKVIKTVGVTGFEELKYWIREQKLKGTYSNNNLIAKMYASLGNEGTWIDQFAESYIGVKLTEWSDTTYQLFVTQLGHDFKQLTSPKEEVLQNNENIVTIQLNNSRKMINIVDLSVKSTTVYANLERMINTAGRNVPRQELEYLIYRLFENYVVKAE